jgi:hypothetical protein
MKKPSDEKSDVTNHIKMKEKFDLEKVQISLQAKQNFLGC